MSELWRSRQMQRSTAFSDDARVILEPGSICWLMSRDDIVDNIEGLAGLPDSCFDHPAVLLWTEGFRVKAVIFTVIFHYHFVRSLLNVCR